MTSVTHTSGGRSPSRWLPASVALAIVVALVVTIWVAMTPASAAQAPVGLGTATPFAVLAGTTVTNTGPSIISRRRGRQPGYGDHWLPAGLIINGTEHAADATALQAQNDLTTAYNDAAGRNARQPR